MQERKTTSRPISYNFSSQDSLCRVSPWDGLRFYLPLPRVKGAPLLFPVSPCEPPSPEHWNKEILHRLRARLGLDNTL